VQVFPVFYRRGRKGCTEDAENAEAVSVSPRFLWSTDRNGLEFRREIPFLKGLPANVYDLTISDERKNQFLQVREDTSRTSEKTPEHLLILKSMALGGRTWM